MFPNPVTFAELSAYCRDFDAGLVHWEKRILIQMDDVVLAVLRGDKRGTAKPGDKIVGQDIPASDPKAVLAMFRRLAGPKKRKT